MDRGDSTKDERIKVWQTVFVQKTTYVVRYSLSNLEFTHLKYYYISPVVWQYFYCCVIELNYDSVVTKWDYEDGIADRKDSVTYLPPYRFVR